jgi:hypothetical protein
MAMWGLVSNRVRPYESKVSASANPINIINRFFACGLIVLRFNSIVIRPAVQTRKHSGAVLECFPPVHLQRHGSAL